MSPSCNATVTTALEHEHRSVDTVVEAISTIADDLEQGRRIDPSLPHEVVFFLRVFADQCQTAKEDSLLFPALEAKCMSPATCLIEGLKNDHERASWLTLELLKAADSYAAGHASARTPLARTLRDLAALYREHIWKEDYLILPLAEKVLAQEEQEMLSRAFQGVETAISSDDVASRIAKHAQRCQCHVGEVFS